MFSNFTPKILRFLIQYGKVWKSRTGQRGQYGDAHRLQDT